MSAFSDARAVPAGSIIETDIAIIGGGAAGITLALALAEKPIRVLLLESGGTEFDAKTQALYAGSLSGVLSRFWTLANTWRGQLRRAGAWILFLRPWTAPFVVDGGRKMS